MNCYIRILYFTLLIRYITQDDQYTQALCVVAGVASVLCVAVVSLFLFTI